MASLPPLARLQKRDASMSRRRGTGTTQHKCAMIFKHAPCTNVTHVLIYHCADVRSGIPFSSNSLLSLGVWLLLSGTTSKLLYSHAFLAHTALK